MASTADLPAALRRALVARGRLTYAAFMHHALYARGSGYYTSGAVRTGASGDFVTSPEVHPVFAALVARQVAECWDLLGQPVPYTVVEVGGGRGRFALDFRQALDAERRDLAAVLRYVLVDPAPGPCPPRVERVRRLPDRVAAGCILMNEVFDALPIHVLERGSDSWCEVYLTLGVAGLCEVLGPVSRAGLARRAERLAPGAPPGLRVEVDTAGPALVRRMARTLGRGYLIAFDYGALDWSQHAATHPAGTLRAFARHAPANALDRPGTVDLTRDVDFGGLVDAARRTNLAVAGVTTQRAFLQRLGWHAYRDALAANASGDVYEANAHALRYLVHPARLGSYVALALAAGGAPPRLTGLVEPQAPACAASAALPPTPVPLLTADHAPLWTARRPPALDFAALWSPPNGE